MPTTPASVPKDNALSTNAMRAVMDVLNPEPLLDLTPKTHQE
jgi:hypothetical protein